MTDLQQGVSRIPVAPLPLSPRDEIGRRLNAAHARIRAAGAPPQFMSIPAALIVLIEAADQAAVAERRTWPELWARVSPRFHAYAEGLAAIPDKERGCIFMVAWDVLNVGPPEKPLALTDQHIDALLDAELIGTRHLVGEAARER